MTDKLMSRFRFCLPAIFIIAAIFLIGCATSLPAGDKLPGKNENGFTYPKYFEAEFRITIDSAKINDSLSVQTANSAIPFGADPVFRLWISDFITLPNQKITEYTYDGIAPDEVNTDFENGNRISFWDLSRIIGKPQKVVISRKFSGILYDYRPELSPKVTLKDYDTTDNRLYYFYTKSEPFLEQTPEIIKLANEITAGRETIKDISASIYNWVYGKMKYVYPPEERGVLGAIKKYEGDCGQYSVLFITLCRSVGIPARQQSGFSIEKGGFGYHIWSEIYFPGTGWVPMDASNKDGYGHIKNTQLVASTGMNIPLKHIPAWATYIDQDAQGNRTDFMQFMTTVKSGFSAKIVTERKLLKLEDLK